MTSFGGQMDFTGPQPFNVPIRGERAVDEPDRLPVGDGQVVPMVRRDMTTDAELYPRQGRGVRSGGLMHRGT